MLATTSIKALQKTPLHLAPRPTCIALLLIVSMLTPWNYGMAYASYPTSELDWSAVEEPLFCAPVRVPRFSLVRGYPTAQTDPSALDPSPTLPPPAPPRTTQTAPEVPPPLVDHRTTPTTPPLFHNLL